jgi:hypothetical protein
VFSLSKPMKGKEAQVIKKTLIFKTLLSVKIQKSIHNIQFNYLKLQELHAKYIEHKMCSVFILNVFAQIFGELHFKYAQKCI